MEEFQNLRVRIQAANTSLSEKLKERDLLISESNRILDELHCTMDQILKSSIETSQVLLGEANDSILAIMISSQNTGDVFPSMVGYHLGHLGQELDSSCIRYESFDNPSRNTCNYHLRFYPSYANKTIYVDHVYEGDSGFNAQTLIHSVCVFIIACINKIQTSRKAVSPSE